MDTLTTTSEVARLRAALTEAGFTYDTVAGRLGPVAHAALSRNETTPALRATADGSPLSTLTRLWPLQAAVPEADADRALPGLLDVLCAEGVLERCGGEVRARVDIRPYAADDQDFWVVSDLTPGMDGACSRVASDHVLGVSGASVSLAQLTVREPAGRALDLGTGCGVQALHLAGHTRHVVSTDVNRRALRMVRLTAALNEVSLDVREGSLFEPVAGERFDLIVTNPPFVISPATGERLVYRDSGLPGDELVRRVVTLAPGHLNPGGWCQLLANWPHVRGQAWEERVSGWLSGSGCDAWVLQREVVDVAEYVELWLKDAGLHGAPDYASRYDAWLAWFDEQGVDAVGFGWVNLRKLDEAGQTGREPVLRVESWPFEVEQPLGGEVADWARRTAFAACIADADLLAARLVTRPDVRQETLGPPGAEDPETIVLRQQRGLRRARQVDTVLAGLVGACDGDLGVGQILDALAQILDRPAQALRDGYLPKVRELVEDGFLATGLR